MKKDISRIVELKDVSPKIFGYIFQCMNTQSVLVPSPPEPPELQESALEDFTAFKTILNMPDWRVGSRKAIFPKESIDLGTLARICFLADYLMIPRVQNMAIHLIHRRLLARGTPLFYFGELIDAVGVALGIDDTMAK